MAALALPVCPVNHIFEIEPRDLVLPAANGSAVTVKAPSAHIGQQKLQMRLMSGAYRLGQVSII